MKTRVRPNLEHVWQSSTREAQQHPSTEYPLRRGDVPPLTLPPTPPAQAVPPAQARAHPVAEVDAVSLGIRPYLVLIQRYRVLLLLCLILCAATFAVRGYMEPQLFMARASILPSGGQGQGGMLGFIASFAGAPPMGGMGEENSSLLFPRILESRTVGVSVLTSKYQFRLEGRNVEQTLVEYLGAETLGEALTGLASLRAVDVDKETGLIRISVRTLSPELSSQVVDRYVDELEKINLVMRKKSASLNSSFIQERVENTLRELEQAEQELTQFLQNNVRINDPELELEMMRLKRDVTLKSQVYMTLTNQAEVARIEEAKDLPVVRVLDRASVPTEPVPNPRLSGIIMGIILGVVVGILSVAGLEIFKFLRSEFRAIRVT